MLRERVPQHLVRKRPAISRDADDGNSKEVPATSKTGSLNAEPGEMITFDVIDGEIVHRGHCMVVSVHNLALCTLATAIRCLGRDCYLEPEMQ